MEKMDFEAVDFVFDALFNAFHPEGVDEKGAADMKFVSLWTLFLTTAGWTEDEYWHESKSREEHCEHCNCECHTHEDDDILPENKSN